VTVRRALLAPLALAAVPAIAALASPEPAPSAAPLSVRIERPLGGQTTERVLHVMGRVAGPAGDRLTLVFNGVPMSVPISGGRFDLAQVLSPGLNTFRAVVEAGGKAAEDSVSVFARVPAKDLRITLTWDTPGTDVDLWVTGPDGEKVLYSHREGKAGGILDTDVTTGFGPETYTQARLQHGTYLVQAHYYRGADPTRVVVTTIRGEGTPDEERRVFRSVLWKTNDVAQVGEFVAR
jgi:uncharacterized protein YfaP (DUF2135 family)